MSSDEILQLTRKLYAAFNDSGPLYLGGTDEEAVYDVLTYARDNHLTKELIDCYAKEYPGELSIEAELEDELSGDEYNKAIKLYQEGIAASSAPSKPPPPATSSGSSAPSCVAGTAAPGCPASTPSAPTSLMNIITNFSSRINSSRSTDRKLTEEGQFFCSGCLYDLALSVIDTHFPTTTPYPAIRNNLILLCKAYYGGDTTAIPPLESSVKTQLNSLSTKPAEISALLTKRGATATAEGLLQEFNRLGYFPDDKSKYANFQLIGLVSAREYIICGTLAQYAINRFYKQGGASRPRNSFGALLANSAKSDDPKKPKYAAKRYYDWNGNTVKHDLVVYPDITSKIQRIKQRLDNGYPFHARVLSGLGNGHELAKKVRDAQGAATPPAPESIVVGEEHSITIIGYENNTFVFWDPDSTVSRYKPSSTTEIKGFGTLTFQSGRLTTAVSEADLFVDTHGSHLTGGKNKRYQILTMFS
jgi:hypothetical protein